MIYWYGQRILLFLLIGFCWGGRVTESIADEIVISNRNDDGKLLAQGVLGCGSIDATYQEIYSFETQNYYINVCRLGNSYYYHRQSKSDSSSVLIPANALSVGSVFQATDGKTDYFVGKNGDRYYSSVMQNSNEIVFEPELLPPTELSREIAEANSALPKVQSEPISNASVNPDGSQELLEMLICTEEKAEVHPHLDRWQKLIGKSKATANSYAVDNGHNFVYDDRTPNLASIETQEGCDR